MYQTLCRLEIIEKKKKIRCKYSLKYSLKRGVASNRLREDTAPGNSGDRALCSNGCTVRGTLLIIILDNWAVFHQLWVGILEGKVDSGIWEQVMRVQTQKQSFNSFFWNNWELLQATYLLLYNIHTVML